MGAAVIPAKRYAGKCSGALASNAAPLARRNVLQQAIEGGVQRTQANLREALCRQMQRRTGNETRMSGAQTRAEVIK